MIHPVSTTEVVVTLNVEGVHCWPGVVNTPYASVVGFLKHPHRHVFMIKAWKVVSHDDRDVEIIDLKHRILEYIKKFWPSEHGHVDFGMMSCEAIARELAMEFKLSEIQVLEDGENGARLTFLWNA